MNPGFAGVHARHGPRTVAKATGPTAQRGLVLLLAMVFLLLLGMLSAGLMRGTGLELRMAANDQFQALAMQQASAIVDELASARSNYRLEEAPGYTLCESGGTCDAPELAAPAAIAALPTGAVASYRIERRPPRLRLGLPLREPEAVVSSARAYNAAVFDVRVRVHAGEHRMAGAHLARGMAVRVAGDRL